MTRARTAVAAVVALVALVAAMLLAGPMAAANARGTRGAASTAPAYPPSQCSSLSIDRTRAAPGDPIVVGGVGYRPGATVTVVLDPDGADTVLGHAKVGRDGTFTLTITFPAVSPGPHSIVVRGEQAAACGADPADNSVGVLGLAAQGGTGSPTTGPGGTATSPAAGGAAVGDGSGGGAGGLLSSTGVDIAIGVLMALALLAAGALLLGGDRATRRRRGRLIPVGHRR